MRKLTALTIVAIIFSGVGTSAAHAKKERGTAASKCPGHVQGVYYYRHATRYWEGMLHRKPSKSNFNASKIKSCHYVVWVAHLWASRAAETKAEYQQELERQRQTDGALTSDWLCIHHYEGAWNAHTGNGYYGGLQMDYAFMSLYGPEFLSRWGTADHWPVWAQVTAANRAKNSGRGYHPWPNTARMCGLL